MATPQETDGAYGAKLGPAQTLQAELQPGTAVAAASTDLTTVVALANELRVIMIATGAASVT